MIQKIMWHAKLIAAFYRANMRTDHNRELCIQERSWKVWLRGPGNGWFASTAAGRSLAATTAASVIFCGYTQQQQQPAPAPQHCKTTGVGKLGRSS